MFPARRLAGVATCYQSDENGDTPTLHVVCDLCHEWGRLSTRHECMVCPECSFVARGCDTCGYPHTRPCPRDEPGGAELCDDCDEEATQVGEDAETDLGEDGAADDDATQVGGDEGSADGVDAAGPRCMGCDGGCAGCDPDGLLPLLCADEDPDDGLSDHLPGREVNGEWVPGQDAASHDAAAADGAADDQDAGGDEPLDIDADAEVVDSADEQDGQDGQADQDGQDRRDADEPMDCSTRDSTEPLDSDADAEVDTDSDADADAADNAAEEPDGQNGQDDQDGQDGHDDDEPMVLDGPTHAALLAEVIRRHAQVDGQDAGHMPDSLSAGAIDLLSASEGPSLPASSAPAHVAPPSGRSRRGTSRPSYREARAYRQGGQRAAPEPPEGPLSSQGGQRAAPEPPEGPPSSQGPSA